WILRLQLVAAVPAEARIHRVHGCTVPTRDLRQRRGRRISRVADCVLEILDRAADSLPELGQPIGPEDNDHDDEDDDQFRESDAAHGETPPGPPGPEQAPE